MIIFLQVYFYFEIFFFPARINLIELFVCLDFKWKLYVFKEYIGHGLKWNCQCFFLHMIKWSVSNPLNHF